MPVRILLVDDEKEFVATLAERLELRGIDADWVTTGEAALAKAAERAYDLAILDVKMPGISGLKLEKLMAQRHPGMKFIFLTGHGSASDYHSGIAEDRVVDYLVKPVNIEALITKMQATLTS
jgi:DNA-binding response OmpR family regulator